MARIILFPLVLLVALVSCNKIFATESFSVTTPTNTQSATSILPINYITYTSIDITNTATVILPTETNILQMPSLEIYYSRLAGDYCVVLSVSLRGGTPQTHAKLSSLVDCSGVRVSPDGQQIVFHQYSDSTVVTYVSDIDGSNPIKIFEGNSWFHWGEKWSPDGKMVAILSTPSEPVCDGSMECNSLYIVKLGESTKVKEVTQFVYNGALDIITWSPNSQWIVYPTTALSVGLININDYTEIGPFIHREFIWPINWSPDSKALVYLSTMGTDYLEDKKASIVFYTIEGKEIIIDVPWDYFSINGNIGVLYLPDESGFILYSSSTKSLILLKMDGSFHKTITTVKKKIRNLKLSRDGKWTFFIEDKTLKAVISDRSELLNIIENLQSDYAIIETKIN